MYLKSYPLRSLCFDLDDKLEGQTKGLFSSNVGRGKEDKEDRSSTMEFATKQLFTQTQKYRYTIIDVPGQAHPGSLERMIAGATGADVAVLMVPADGSFNPSIRKGDIKAGRVPGQTRNHARLLSLLGVRQLIVCVNKMDTIGYNEERFKMVRNKERP